MENKQTPSGQFVTNDEVDFITKEGAPYQRIIIGMLISTRKNEQTVISEYEDIMSNEDNSEHRPAYIAGKFFLASFATRFKIKPK